MLLSYGRRRHYPHIHYLVLSIASIASICLTYAIPHAIGVAIPHAIGVAILQPLVQLSFGHRSPPLVMIGAIVLRAQ
uniref:Uncharacterized protein n=1 Tax=Fagus sylvatica TaxID=28930 RepID=A0A2N9EQU5_FAGSY